MIETADEARAAVEAMRYPPDGVRGMASARASKYGLDFEDYVETANEQLLTVLQIETERGVTNAAAIAAVDGVDALLVGPSDLSASLGSLADWTDPTVTDAIDTVIHDSDVPVGTLAVSDDDINQWVDQGFDFAIVGTDANYLARGARKAQQVYEDALDRREEE